MARVTDTVAVSGVRCEQCVMRLGAALQGHDGLEAANANLLGEVTLTWDDERTTREALVAAMESAGFSPLGASAMRVGRDDRPAGGTAGTV